MLGITSPWVGQSLVVFNIVFLVVGLSFPWVGQSLVVFNVVFLVVGLSLIVTARLGFQDLVFADLTFTFSS